MWYVCDMCYVCVHLFLLLGGLSICCDLCCVWVYGLGMLVLLWRCGILGGFVFYVILCCDWRLCLCVRGDMQWVGVSVQIQMWACGWRCRSLCAAYLNIRLLLLWVL